MSEQKLTVHSLRDLSRVFFRRKSVVLSGILLVPLTVYVGLQFKTPVYRAKAKMLVSGEQQPGAIYYRDIAPQRNTDLNLTRSETVKSIPVLTMVVDALNLDRQPLEYEAHFASPLKKLLINNQTKKLHDELQAMDASERQSFLYARAIENLRKKISVETIRNTNLFSVSVDDFNPKMAAKTANTITLAYMIVDLREQLSELQLKYGNQHPTIIQLNDNIRQISDIMNDDSISPEMNFRPASVKPVEQAIAPSRPIGPDSKWLLLASIFFGLIFGISSAMGIDNIDHTIKSPLDLETLLRVPLLGCIPKKRTWQRLIVKNPARANQNNDYQDSYRQMSDKLRFLIKQKDKKCLLFTSSEQEEGTSTVLVNLANYLSAQHGMKVLVMDANMRTPEIHTLFKLDQSPGLSDILTSQMTLNQVANRINNTLSVVTAGTLEGNPSALLFSPAMEELIQRCREKYDAVLMDSPHLKNYQDAADTAQLVDGAVLLASENRTRKHILRSVLNSLTEHNIPLVGSVLNMRTYVIPNFIYRRL